MSFIFHSILLLKFKINITQGSKQKDNKGKVSVKGSKVEKKKHDNLKRMGRGRKKIHVFKYLYLSIYLAFLLVCLYPKPLNS